MGLLHFSFRSWCLNTNTDIEVILPSIKEGQNAQEYYRSGKKYPVLWLLHGTLGNYTDYLRRTNIELYATENDLVVVMPSALNSNYSNWNNITPPFRMFDYFIDEGEVENLIRDGEFNYVKKVYESYMKVGKNLKLLDDNDNSFYGKWFKELTKDIEEKEYKETIEISNNI